MPEGLVRELTESGQLSFHTGNIAGSRRLNIPRTAYYWYGGFVAKRAAMMPGCYDIYLWNEMMRPDSDVVSAGDARYVVACYFICQQICRLLKAVRLNWRKQQGVWGSRAELDEAAHRYKQRLRGRDNGARSTSVRPGIFMTVLRSMPFCSILGCFHPA